MSIFKNKYGCASLVVNLDPYFEKPFAELPDDIQQLVQAARLTSPWDELSVDERQEEAAMEDYTNDPTREADLRIQLSLLRHNLEEDRDKAKNENDSNYFVLDDVVNRIEGILKIDRERVGSDIQQLVFPKPATYAFRTSSAIRKPSRQSHRSTPSASPPGVRG